MAEGLNTGQTLGASLKVEPVVRLTDEGSMLSAALETSSERAGPNGRPDGDGSEPAGSAGEKAEEPLELQNVTLRL